MPADASEHLVQPEPYRQKLDAIVIRDGNRFGRE